MRPTSWALGLLLLACRGQAPPSPAEAYAQAMAQGDPTACAAIERTDLRGECLVFVAADRAEAGDLDGARAICGSLPAGTWKDECGFHLADRLRAEGPLAVELCAAAGSFQTPCLAHAISRQSSEIIQDMPPGQEAATLLRLEEMAQEYVGPRMGRTRARQNLRQVLAARFRARDFDPSGCGSAPLDLCREVYQELVNQAVLQRAPGGPSGQDRLARVCQEGASLTMVQSQGLPAWTPAGAPMALSAWRELCDRRRLLAPRLRPASPHRAPAGGDTGA